MRSSHACRAYRRAAGLGTLRRQVYSTRKPTIQAWGLGVTRRCPQPYTTQRNSIAREGRSSAYYSDGTKPPTNRSNERRLQQCFASAPAPDGREDTAHQRWGGREGAAVYPSYARVISEGSCEHDRPAGEAR